MYVYIDAYKHIYVYTNDQAAPAIRYAISTYIYVYLSIICIIYT